MQGDEPLDSLSEQAVEHQEVSDWRIVAAYGFALYVIVWAVLSRVTKDIWIGNLLRPYLPDWALLASTLSFPITGAVIGLRMIPWRISAIFGIVGSFQASMSGLLRERYPFVSTVLAVLVGLEVYFVLPYLNRRGLEPKQDGTILHLR